MDPLLKIGFLAVILAVAGFVVLYPRLPTAPVSNAPDDPLAPSSFYEGVEIPPSAQYHALSECPSLDYAGQLDCRRQIAVQNKDLGICDPLPLPDAADCTQMALQLNDPAFCTQLQADEIAFCKARVLVAANDFSSCQTLSENAANQCRLDAAQKTGQPEHCKNISRESLRDDCYRTVAGQAADLDVCQSVSDNYVRDDCFIRVILNESMPSIGQCDYILDMETKDDCIYGVAIIQGDPSVCNGIADETWRDWCVTDITNPEPLDLPIEPDEFA